MKRMILTYGSLLLSVMFFSGFVTVTAPSFQANQAIEKSFWHVESYTVNGDEQMHIFKNSMFVFGNDRIAIMSDGYTVGYGATESDLTSVKLVFEEEQWSALNGMWKSNSDEGKSFIEMSKTDESQETSFGPALQFI